MYLFIATFRLAEIYYCPDSTPLFWMIFNIGLGSWLRCAKLFARSLAKMPILFLHCLHPLNAFFDGIINYWVPIVSWSLFLWFADRAMNFWLSWRWWLELAHGVWNAPQNRTIFEVFKDPSWTTSNRALLATRPKSTFWKTRT